MKERRINQTLAYHVPHRHAAPGQAPRRHMADQRIKRLLPGSSTCPSGSSSPRFRVPPEALVMRCAW